jgi:DNA replication ATP-dependent helicase Dna2
MVKTQSLQEIGITDLGQSLFERLFLKAQAAHWDWAYAQLTHQGRMHADIMGFPAQTFYQGQLRCLPADTPVHERQHAPLSLRLPDDANVLEQQLAQSRLLFIPTPSDTDSPTLKTNQHEARLVVDLIRAFQRLRDQNGQVLAAGELGVITPYRAQIAQIRRLMEEVELSPDDYTIDTVERYQGGARQIIIISLCTNAERQLAAISSMSLEGVDRKLNVAMTRAREHLVVLGNPDILKKQPVYQQLLEWCKRE